jgi:hypothetical protein
VADRHVNRLPFVRFEDDLAVEVRAGTAKTTPLKFLIGLKLPRWACHERASRIWFVTHDGSSLVTNAAHQNHPCAISWNTHFTGLNCGRWISPLRRRATPSCWRAMQPTARREHAICGRCYSHRSNLINCNFDGLNGEHFGIESLDHWH